MIINPDNKIDNLNYSSGRRYFHPVKLIIGKQLGGNDITITLYRKENSSGTYEFFKDHVLR